MKQQQAYRLGTIRNIKLRRGGGGAGLNLFYRRILSSSSAVTLVYYTNINTQEENHVDKYKTLVSKYKMYNVKQGEQLLK